MLGFLLFREDFDPQILSEDDLVLRFFVDVVSQMLSCEERDFLRLPEDLVPNMESMELFFFLPLVPEPNKAVSVDDFFPGLELEPNNASNLDLSDDLRFLLLEGTKPSGVGSSLSTTYFDPICLFLFFCSFDNGELPVLTSMYFVSFFPVNQSLLFALRSCPLPVRSTLYPLNSKSRRTLSSPALPRYWLSRITCLLVFLKASKIPNTFLKFV